MTIPLNFGSLLALIWTRAAAQEISSLDVGGAVSAFGFFSGFLSYILATIASRKAYVHIERRVTIVIALQGFAIFLGIMDLTTNGVAFLEIQNFLFKMCLLIWATSLFAMYSLLDQVICIDRIRFKKPGKTRIDSLLGKAKPLPPFHQFQDLRPHHGRVQKFGVECVDHFIELAQKEEQKLFFPILLVASKHFRPWRICLRFAAAGLMHDERIIYFAFNQPADTVVGQLADHLAYVEGANVGYSELWWKDHEASKAKFDNLYVIDCCSPWVAGRPDRKSDEESEESDKKGPIKKALLKRVQDRKHIFSADPRNPIALGSNYNKALRKVIHEANPGEPVFVRVVYDSISDLLEYGDPQSSMQLIKHNMIWEEQNRANSLYLFIPGVPQPNLPNPVDIEFLRWNTYCEIDFEYQKTGREHMFIDSLFLERKESEVKIQTSNNDYVRKGR